MCFFFSVWYLSFDLGLSEGLHRHRRHAAASRRQRRRFGNGLCSEILPTPPPPPFLFPVRPFRKRLTVCPLRTELLDALAGVDALQRRPCGHEAAGTETKRERVGQRWLHGPDDRLQGRLQRYLHGPDQG